ncbi:MAG: NTP transferase domain-containing protein [Deltaproteobacteria bacterium]|nr:NTP transferase domain-containing protein [Deltaproteobacteria bacterium]
MSENSIPSQDQQESPPQGGGLPPKGLASDRGERSELNKAPLAPAVLILAAGKGTRMKSQRPKVLFEILGRSLLAYSLNAARYLNPELICVVVGKGAAEVERAVGGPGIVFVTQEEQLGTGHATLMAAELLEGHAGPLVILPGDAPLISPQTLLDLVDAHRILGSDLSVLTVEAQDPGAYGRILRDPDGWLKGIVEYKDASREELLINEVNSGVYVGNASDLFPALREIRPENVQKEYYLTDVVEVFRARNRRVAAVMGPDPEEIQGVNDREDLFRAREILRLKILRSWLKAGVSMDDPYTTVIEPSVRLEEDVTLGPGVILKGTTKIMAGSTIGAYSVISNVVVEGGLSLPPHSVINDQVLKKGPLVPKRHPVPPPKRRPNS